MENASGFLPRRSYVCPSLSLFILCHHSSTWGKTFLASSGDMS